jgi:hypothetical protein
VSATVESFPKNAIIAGEANGNEPLYIGRTMHTDYTIGKIHPSQGGLYIPYKGKEYKHAHYAVLTTDQNSSNITGMIMIFPKIVYTRHFFFYFIDHRWIATSKFKILPRNAVYAGTDSNKDATFVGRFLHADNILPAKVIPKKKSAFAAYEKKEILADTYEVL